VRAVDPFDGEVRADTAEAADAAAADEAVAAAGQAEDRAAAAAEGGAGVEVAGLQDAVGQHVRAGAADRGAGVPGEFA
jgi:hypothetical protein